MTGWVRREPAVHVAGDVGGDVQASEAYDARWTRDLRDGLTAMVTRTCYAIVPDSPGPRVREMEEETEYLACSDPADPGNSEWSEYIYRPVYGFSPTDLGARAAAYGAEPPCDDEWEEVAPDWLPAPADASRTLADDDVDEVG